MQRFHFTVILLIFILIFSACSMPAGQPAQDPGAVYTSAAQTVQALLPTATLSAAAQPRATQALSVTPTPTAGCEDAALNTAWNRDGALYDVKVVNQPLAPNTPFVMSWTFQNTGACTWDKTYLMYFESGTPLTQSPGYPIVQAGQTVAPGESVTVDIGMTAPAKTGDYEATWRLQNNQGEALMTFGVMLKVGSGVSQAPPRPGTLKYSYDCTSGVLKIGLTWSDKAGDEEGYRVYRDGALIADLDAGSTAYEDIAPIIAGNYTYTVASFNAAGESPAQITADTSNCH